VKGSETDTADINRNNR